MSLSLELGPTLREFIAKCETVCVAGCCGLDAFDIHAVHLSSLLRDYNDETRAYKLDHLESELATLESTVQELTPDAHGFVCSFELLNASFTPASFREFAMEIRNAAQNAMLVLAYAESLE